jgi:hypothetical protein
MGGRECSSNEDILQVSAPSCRPIRILFPIYKAYVKKNRSILIPFVEENVIQTWAGWERTEWRVTALVQFCVATDAYQAPACQFNDPKLVF